ncbi:MAG: hypothetical protein QXI16_04535 [Sulfolobaceae archaeon]
MSNTWLAEFTDSVSQIKDTISYVKVSTSILEKLEIEELTLSKLENELLLKKAAIYTQNDKLSAEKLELVALQDETYQKKKQEKEAVEVTIQTLKRALDILKQFKDLYIAELHS